MEPVATKVLDGLLEGLVLHALERDPSHGYGILKELEATVGEEPSKNRVYRILRELEEAGCVESEEVTEASRTRQVYSLTDRGADRLGAYRNLPGPLKTWLAELFAVRDGGGEAAEEPAPPARDQRDWVARRLDELPRGAGVRAPHASFSVERSPGESRWQLTVERHAPGDYEGSGECPLTFLYLATQRLLYDREP